jgi:hypothetical protein
VRAAQAVSLTKHIQTRPMLGLLLQLARRALIADVIGFWLKADILTFSVARRQRAACF